MASMMFMPQHQPGGHIYFKDFLDNFASKEAPDVAGDIRQINHQFSSGAQGGGDTETGANLHGIASRFAQSDGCIEVKREAARVSARQSWSEIGGILKDVLRASAEKMAYHVVVAFFFLLYVLAAAARLCLWVLRAAFDFVYNGITTIINTAVEAIGGWRNVFKIAVVAGACAIFGPVGLLAAPVAMML
ncbi:uncharacterized protein LOC101864305 [Aplysia californica]|uniref:Uncharacterized protein LOC101864305 n=1 Tax=Aplysia californica TaxID=6500 RepID=A0ABM0JT12_APLCA|nr:uncharacterized protein LOC101864305 [Aplysia californica]